MKSLLREYAEYLTEWDEIKFETYERVDDEDRNKTIPSFKIKFCRTVIKYGYNKQVTGYEDSTDRKFDFTLEELDKAIDRYRQKIKYEKDKRSTQNP